MTEPVAPEPDPAPRMSRRAGSALADHYVQKALTRESSQERPDAVRGGGGEGRGWGAGSGSDVVTRTLTALYELEPALERALAAYRPQRSKRRSLRERGGLVLHTEEGKGQRAAKIVDLCLSLFSEVAYGACRRKAVSPPRVPGAVRFGTAPLRR